MKTNKLCSQSSLQLQFIIFSGRVSYRSLLASPHTQPTFNLLWLLTLTLYAWGKSFNRTHRKIGAYSFTSQLIHLKGDVTNNNSWYVPRYFPSTWCLQKKRKRNILEHFDSCIKSKCIKVNDRPFAEGSRGIHSLLIFGCTSS